MHARKNKRKGKQCETKQGAKLKRPENDACRASRPKEAKIARPDVHCALLVVPSPAYNPSKNKEKSKAPSKPVGLGLSFLFFAFRSAMFCLLPPLLCSSQFCGGVAFGSRAVIIISCGNAISWQRNHFLLC